MKNARLTILWHVLLCNWRVLNCFSTWCGSNHILTRVNKLKKSCNCNITLIFFSADRSSLPYQSLTAVTDSPPCPRIKTIKVLISSYPYPNWICNRHGHVQLQEAPMTELERRYIYMKDAILRPELKYDVLKRVMYKATSMKGVPSRQILLWIHDMDLNHNQ